MLLDSRAPEAVEALARRATPHVSRSRFVNFSAQRNRALERCRGDLGLVHRSRRAGDPGAGRRNPGVDRRAPRGWAGAWVPRRNFMFGHEVRHAGWSPDYQLRLLRRRRALRRGPRRPRGAGGAGATGPPPGAAAALQLRHLGRSSRQAARLHRPRGGGAGGPGHPRQAPELRLQPLREFRRRYVSLGGWRDGPLGLLLSLAMAYYTLRMYLRLARQGAGSRGQGG